MAAINHAVEYLPVSHKPIRHSFFTVHMPRNTALLNRCALIFLLALPWFGFSATLTGSFTPLTTGANIDLTAVGPVDWIHWGQFTEFAYDQKFTPTHFISDYTVIDTGQVPADGPFQTSTFVTNGYSWQDGLQNSLVTNTATGDYMTGRSNGFSITVPVGATTNIFRVYVASVAGGGDFNASLSDGSAVPYANSSASVVEGYYTLTNAGASAGATLTITWLGSANSSVIVLQSAALAYLQTNNPPTATLTVPSLNANLSASSTQTLQAVASDSDGSVALVEFFAEQTNKLGEAAAPPYSLDWTNITPGPHSLTVKATDNLGATYTSKPLDVFAYSSGGSLTGSGTVPPASLVLSDEGTNDWAHWGLTSSNSFDHKAAVTSQISNLTLIGANNVMQYGDNLTAYSWVGGSPTDSASSSTTGVFVYGLTNGFQLALPAGRQPRVAKIYVGLYGARSDFRAWLSDGSAPAFSDTTLSSSYNNAYQVYTLNYTAGSNNQTLIIRQTALNSFDSHFGNVTLQAATLSLLPAPLSPIILLTNVVSSSNIFSFSFGTDPGVGYQVFYADSLASNIWLPLTNFTGDGSVFSITDSNTVPSRFYRVLRP